MERRRDLGRPSDGGAPAERSETALRPPVWLLLVGAGCVASSALLLTQHSRVADFVGYGLATICTVLAVAVYRTIDSRRRTRPTYEVPALAQWLRPPTLSWALLATGTVVGGIHVWRFAEAVARS